MPEPQMDLVKVYEGSNPAIVPLIESLLRDAEIEFLMKGDQIQDLFGAGRFAMNSVAGPVEFWVRADDADDARELLADVD